MAAQLPAGFLFDDVEYVEIGLAIVDDAGGQFRLDEPIRSVTALETAIIVRYGLVDTIHGTLSGAGSQRCSIFVFDFYFDTIRSYSTIRRVNVDVVVSDPGREIGTVVPVQRVSLNPHGRTVENTVGLAASYFWINANTQRATNTETVGYATVKGWPSYEPERRKREQKPYNCAKWLMLENPVGGGGVPPHLRVAFQVLRSGDEPFDLNVRLNAKANWRTRIQTLFGQTPQTSPINVNPTDMSTERAIKGYDANNLEQVALHDVFGVSYGLLVDNFSRTV